MLRITSKDLFFVQIWSIVIHLDSWLRWQKQEIDQNAMQESHFLTFV